jgi:hypothetical protein
MVLPHLDHVDIFIEMIRQLNPEIKVFGPFTGEEGDKDDKKLCALWKTQARATAERIQKGDKRPSRKWNAAFETKATDDDCVRYNPRSDQRPPGIPDVSGLISSTSVGGGRAMALCDRC